MDLLEVTWAVGLGTPYEPALGVRYKFFNPPSSSLIIHSIPILLPAYALH